MKSTDVAFAQAPAAVVPRSLDIVVPIYRSAELVRACLASLIENIDEVAQHSPRMILVNDSPDDQEVSDLLRESWLSRPDVLRLENERNLGFVRSVNRALELSRKARHDVLLVNSDTRTFPRTLANLLSAAKRDPQIAFASPRSNNAALCSLPHFYGGSIGDPAAAYERWRALSATMPEWHFSPTAVGFYMYIRSDVLADHGLLAEEFGKGYEEENDLVLRAGKVGKRAVIVNSAFAYHAGGASFIHSEIADLHGHRQRNHELVTQRHPEFIPLVRRYENSAHFRAERMMAGLLRDDNGRIRIAFDLTGLGEHHNGTNEHTIAVLKALAQSWRHKYRLAGVASAASFAFHGLDRIDGLHRAEPDAPGLHAVAIRVAQPFTIEHVSRVESLAPTCIYAMLDTIAEDCGPISAEYDVAPLWDHVADNASGLIFNSAVSEAMFRTRHAVGDGVLTRARLLSTDVDDYKELDAPSNESRSHVLILGNHFPHKATQKTVELLRGAFPQLSFVAISDRTSQDGNLATFRSGGIDRTTMRQLFRAASVIVLPSHMEGFGMGLMHALANHKPVVARRIPATLEILDQMGGVSGVELFDTDLDLIPALTRAMANKGARVAPGNVRNDWNAWASELTGLVDAVVGDKDLFGRLRRRIAASQRLQYLVRAGAQSIDTPSTPAASMPAPPMTIDRLLELEGADFIRAVYSTLLQRQPDSDGLKTYIARLHGAESKLDILSSISTSAEGVQKVDPKTQVRIDELIRERGERDGPSAIKGPGEDRGDPVSPESEMETILKLKGVEFIERAYRFILGRQPDENGIQNYMKVLGRGGTQLDVMWALYESIEARALAKTIPALESRRSERAAQGRKAKWKINFSK